MVAITPEGWACRWQIPDHFRQVIQEGSSELGGEVRLKRIRPGENGILLPLRKRQVLLVSELGLVRENGGDILSEGMAQRGLVTFMRDVDEPAYCRRVGVLPPG